jgi:hypothetical protein
VVRMDGAGVGDVITYQVTRVRGVLAPMRGFPLVAAKTYNTNTVVPTVQFSFAHSFMFSLPSLF